MVLVKDTRPSGTFGCWMSEFPSRKLSQILKSVLETVTCLVFVPRISPAWASNHLNSARAGMGEASLDYRWSSYKAYASSAIDVFLDQPPS